LLKLSGKFGKGVGKIREIEILSLVATLDGFLRV